MVVQNVSKLVADPNLAEELQKKVVLLTVLVLFYESSNQTFIIKK